MKKITYAIGVAFILLTTSNAVAQQGFGTNRPEKSAAVEIKSKNKGLLIPRISLTGVSDTSTIKNPVNSLIIYNESNANGLLEGYYYFSTTASKWIPLLDGKNLQNGSGTKIATNANGSTRVDLGGDLLVPAEIITSDSNTFALLGLKEVTNLTGHNVVISDTQTGVLRTVLVKDLMDSSTTNSLIHVGTDSTTLNTMVSIVNGAEASAPIILENKLIPSSDADTNTSITSIVNGVRSGELDLEPIVQEGQIKYNVLSSDSSVAVNKIDSSTTDNLVTYDIKVASTNAENGLYLDSSTSSIKLGGELIENTTIKADTNTLAITGLKIDTATTNYMVVMGQDGVLKKTLMGSNNAVVYINGAGDSTTANEMSNMETIIVNTNSGSHTIILPAATDGNKGKRYFIKKTGDEEIHSLTITVDRGGKIDGINTGGNGQDIISTLPYQSWIFQNDGTANGWFIVGH